MSDKCAIIERPSCNVNLLALRVGIVFQEGLEMLPAEAKLSEYPTRRMFLIASHRIAYQLSMPIFPRGVSTTFFNESPVESPNSVRST
jgi:hypothetical protein